MNSKTQKHMLLLVSLVVVMVVVVLQCCSQDPDDEGSSSSNCKPGEPIAKLISQDNGVPKWEVTNLYKQTESMRYSTTFLVDSAKGFRQEYKGGEFEMSSVCELQIEYQCIQKINADPSNVSVDFKPVEMDNEQECKPEKPIDMKAILSDVLGSPMDYSLPFTALEGCQLIVNEDTLSTIEFGLELRRSFLNNTPLTLSEWTIGDTILHFQ